MTFNDALSMFWEDVPARAEPPAHRVTREQVTQIEAVTPELWDLRVKYAHDARGWRVPAFCVVALPMTTERPQREVVVCRRPGEDGVTWHHRARCEAVHLAAGHGCVTALVQIMFIGTLPPKAWREEQQTRHVLRWRMLNPNVDGLERVWAARKMFDILHPYLVRNPDQEPAAWGR